MGVRVNDGGGGTYTPAPQGVHQAVCCDVVDLGMVESEYQGEKKTVHKIRVVWQISEAMEDGRPFTVSARYTASLHEKARLRADLQSWRGRPFTKEELKDFDTDDVIGGNCLLNVMHESRNGKTYANVSAIMPLPKGTRKMDVTPDYIRQRDRTPTQAAEPMPTPQAMPAPEPEAHDITDDDIPF